MDNKNNMKGFPNPFAPKKVKDSTEYALAFAKAIERVSKNQYFVERNKRFKICTDFARGDQPIQPYLDWMNIDGKKPFVYLDYTPSPIAKKLIDTVVSKYMGIDEEIRATGIDLGSLTRKDEEVKSAKFRMNFKDQIGDISQAAGFPMEDENAFTPETDSELDLYKTVMYRTREEIILETALDVIFNNNDRDETKRMLLWDLCVRGVAATKAYMDANGKIKYRHCNMANLIYSYSSRNDFKDVWWVGEYIPMKISEIRQRWGGKIQEQQLYDIANQARGKYGNPNDYLSPDVDRFGMRQYDDFSAMVLNFCYKTSIEKNYVKRTSATGKESVDRVSDPVNETDTKKNITAYDQVIYEGYYIVGTGFVMDYGIGKNMAKPNSNRGEVLLPYSIYMYGNIDMRNKSMIEMAVPIIRQMDMVYLKIQQVIAKARPAGIAINITALEDIDLGLGGSLNPLEIQEVFDQTGNLYYRSESTEGDRRVEAPITPLVQDIMNNISALIKTWEFHSERLREYIGLNEYVDGSSINPRVGARVVESQVKASNNAIAYIYDAYQSIIERTAGVCGIRFWDQVVIMDNEYYTSIIGKDNANYIKDNKDDLLEVDFNLVLEAIASDEEKQLIESDIQLALNNGIIDLKDAREIRNIRNYKLANLYLEVAREKKRKADLEDANAKSQQNANIQATAGVQVAQARQQADQIKVQAGQVIEETKGEAQLLKSNFEFIQKIISDCVNTGRNIPPFLAPIVDVYLNQIIQPSEALDAAQMQQMLGALQQQAQQQQAQPQGDQNDQSQMQQAA
jgi:hypothetical protein